MPRWQHISYSVVVIELMEKVHPGGGTLGFTNICVNIPIYLTYTVHELISVKRDLRKP